MAITAPYSKHKKGNLKIFAIVLLIAGLWFAYDGYYNQNFIEKHTIQKLDPQGNPVLDEQGNVVRVADTDLQINRKLPPFLLIGAAVFGIMLFLVKNKKIVLSDNKLAGEGKEVDVDNIEKINKTDFESKGVFTITYKDDSGNMKDWKVSDRKYDNLKNLLDELIAKISS